MIIVHDVPEWVSLDVPLHGVFEEPEPLGILLGCGHWTDMERPAGFVETQDVFFCFTHGIQPIVKTNVPKPVRVDASRD